MVVVDNDAKRNGGRGSRPPIVGIGASAGGLESIERVLESLPRDFPAVVLLAQHLSPDYPSQLRELLQRQTALDVRDAVDGETVRPGTVYIMPPACTMQLEADALRVEPADNEGRLKPIDALFSSIACAVPVSRRAGLILSGTGTDGTRGSLAIKEASGLVIVEAPSLAAFSGMPSSVLVADGAHLVLPGDQIAVPLTRFVNGMPLEKVVDQASRADPSDSSRPLPEEVMELLFLQTGHDFRLHRNETMRRRFDRRVTNAAVAEAEYIRRLQRDSTEVDALYRDLLIGVTDFFRDPEAFEALAPALDSRVARKQTGEPLRVWVSGCSTGEEAYSVAILAVEALERAGRAPLELELFATDLMIRRIERAGKGIYSEEAVAPVTSERRERWFRELSDGTYQVRSELRDRCFFSVHDVTRDVPFSRLDLVVCRNLIIYLHNEAQKPVLSSLLYGLEPGGCLFLGSSESLGDLLSQCEAVDETHRIFRKIGQIALPDVLPMLFSEGAKKAPSSWAMANRRRQPRMDGKSSLIEVYDRLLDLYMPPSFLLNAQLELVECFSGAERYLKIPSRRMRYGFHELLSSEDPIAVAAALTHLRDSGGLGVVSPMRVEDRSGQSVEVHLRSTLLKFDSPNESYFLVSLIELGLDSEVWNPNSAETRQVDSSLAPAEGEERDGHSRSPIVQEATTQVRVLEGELTRTRSNLKDAVEDLAATNEELQTANQELAASNEELQSSNEELRSVNDELQRLNDEYQKIIREVRAANTDLKYMFEATEVGLVFLDHRLRIRRYTPSAQDYLRLRSVDVGRSFFELATKLPDEDLHEMVKLVLESGNSIEREAYDDDGDKVLVGARLVSSGAKDGVVLTFTDLSGVQPDRRQVDRIKAVLETTGDSIWSIGSEGEVTTWNRAAAELMQYERDEVLGQNGLFLFAEEVRVGIREQIDRVQKNRTVERSGSLLLRRGGVTIDVELTLSAIENELSEVVGVSFVARDTRALRKSMRQLEISERRYQDLFEHAPDAYLVVEPETARILDCNRTLLEMLGYERSDVVGLSLFQLLTSSSIQEAQANLDLFLDLFSWDSSQPITVRRADGGELSVSMTHSEVRDGNDEVSQIRLTWRDITQRLEVEASLRVEIDRRDRYLAILSHELRNPLNAMRTANQLLSRPEIESEQKEYALRVVDQQTGHMARLLEDLLDTARVLQQKLEVRPEVVCANDVLRAALDSVRGAANERGIEIEQRCDGTLFCKADPDRLQQALANLLNNAVKYSSETDCRIEVELLEVVDEGRDWVVFEVRDNGVGISPTLLPHVFDLFTQADETLDRAGGGMGLGLALVRSIAELHGGYVEAQSEGFCAGSTFCLGLPKVISTPIEPQEELSEARTRRILIVEDQEDSRIGLASLLELEGHEVLMASDGPTGLEVFREEGPDVVLLDIGLPGMSGYEVARQIRELTSEDVTLIALTGYGKRDDVDRAYEAGFDHHMVKPLDPEKLLTLLS